MSLAFAIFCLTAATAVRWAVSTIRPDVPFSPYYPAILFVTVFSGFKMGLVTAICGGILALFVEFSGAPAGTTNAALLVIYAGVASFVMVGSRHYRTVTLHYRKLSQRLLEEEQYRKLVVDELQHRLKNKISTIHAVTHQVLRDQPDVWTKVDGRIRALSRTDELIAKSDSTGCSLQELLVAELEPYGHVRYNLIGPPVFLPGKLAVTLALVIHELATNAAKYGSFTVQSGLVTVSWTLFEENLTLSWEELNGPRVPEVRRSGFGTRLLSSALRIFNGSVQSAFLPNGLHCVLKCRIPAA
jgi:two-component sensor histidine kinase